VDGGAAVDAQDRAGRTALSYAAMYGSTDCIYLLAARGADVAHMDTDGNTPLELAEGSGRQSAVDALKKLQLRVKMQEKRKVGRGGCVRVMAVGGWQCVWLVGEACLRETVRDL
jgi:ankyrin repeat protein